MNTIFPVWLKVGEAAEVLSARELGVIPLRGGTEGIPTLPEVLAVIGGKVPVLIDIKDQAGAMGPDFGPLEASFARALGGP